MTQRSTSSLIYLRERYRVWRERNIVVPEVAARYIASLEDRLEALEPVPWEAIRHCSRGLVPSLEDRREVTQWLIDNAPPTEDEP